MRALRAWCARERELVCVLGLAALFFVYRWWTDMQRPGLAFPNGWWGFNDQGLYLKEATHLGRLEWIPFGEFAYGPGYPAFAAPFTRLGGQEGWPARDPLMVPNLGMWLVAVAATFVVARRMYGRWAGVAAAFALMFATPLIGMVTLPWNSTLVLACVGVVMMVALVARPGPWHGVALGAAVALTYSSRYIDALWVGLAVLTVLWARGALQVRHRALWGAAGGFAVVMAPVLALHWKAFGTPFTTAYTAHGYVGAGDFRFGNILRHAGESFISPYHLGTQHSQTPALLAGMFLVVLAPVGFVLVARRRHGAARRLVLGIGGASALATVVYWSYAYTGSYGLGFGALHFFKAWFPLWTVAAVAAVVELMRMGAPEADDAHPPLEHAP